MSYSELRSRYAHELEVMLDNGEITSEEADRMMEEWEWGYGDYMYDCMKDRQLEEACADEM